MKIISPITIDETNLISSNVGATDQTAWSSTKLYISGDLVQYDITGSHHTYQSLVGSSSNVTISVSSPAVITWLAHGLVAGTPIQFTTTGSFPTGITAGTTYYVTSPTTDTLNISLTVGGSNIVTTGSTSGTYNARASSNIGFTPTTSPSKWLDLGNTNRYKMFDKSVQSQTTNASSISVVVQLSQYADSVVLLNLVGSSVNVTMTSATDGVVYNVTKSLSSSTGITNWYNYFFTPILNLTDIIFDGLPLYANATISITVTAASGNASCGACLIGLATDISSTKKGVEHGAKISIDDYSIKSVDAFGNYTITERPFNRKANWTVYIDGNQVDAAYNLLSSRRATPTVYIGGKDYGSAIVYGFFRTFDIDIAYKDMPAVCSIELAGLT